LYPDDPKFVEKIQTFKENLINKSSKISSIKNGLSTDKRISSIKNSPNEFENDMRISNQFNKREKKKKSKVDDSKFFNKTTSNKNIILNYTNSNNSNREIKFLSKNNNNNNNINVNNFINNPKSDGSFEIVIKKEIKESYEKLKNSLFKENKQVSTLNTENVPQITNTKKNNLQKFNINNIRQNLKRVSNTVGNFYIANKNKNNKDKYFSNVNNPNYIIDLSNPKIKIKLTNNVKDNYVNPDEIITGLNRNKISEAFNSNNFEGKQINIKINNNITNHFNMKDFAFIDEKIKIKDNLSEDEIQQKLNLYRSKLNSEMLKYLNEEKIREKERQDTYEHLKDNQEKCKFGQEVSKERNETSEKIIMMNL